MVVASIGEMIPQDEEGILICNHSACGHQIERCIEIQINYSEIIIWVNIILWLNLIYF
jgi:hypothetical protein